MKRERIWESLKCGHFQRFFVLEREDQEEEEDREAEYGLLRLGTIEVLLWRYLRDCDVVDFFLNLFLFFFFLGDKMRVFVYLSFFFFFKLVLVNLLLKLCEPNS